MWMQTRPRSEGSSDAPKYVRYVYDHDFTTNEFFLPQIVNFPYKVQILILVNVVTCVLEFFIK